MPSNGIWHTTVARQSFIVGMPEMRLCTATSENGTYSCLFTAEPSDWLGEHVFAARPKDVMLASPMGRQTKLAVTLKAGFGMTEQAALSDACAEFTRWVGEQVRTAPVQQRVPRIPSS